MLELTEICSYLPTLLANFCVVVLVLVVVSDLFGLLHRKFKFSFQMKKIYSKRCFLKMEEKLERSSKNHSLVHLAMRSKERLKVDW